MIVRHMPERHVPDPRQFQNSVARIRRAGLDDMRKGVDIAIARRSDAAGIDDQAPVAKPDRARDVGVAAENEPLRDPLAAFSIASCEDIRTVPSGRTLSSQ